MTSYESEQIEWRTTPEFAKLMSVQVRTLRRWHKNGTVPAHAADEWSWLKYGPVEIQRIQVYLELAKEMRSWRRARLCVRILERLGVFPHPEEQLIRAPGRKRRRHFGPLKRPGARVPASVLTAIVRRQNLR